MKELGHFYGCDNSKLSSFALSVWAGDGTDILLGARKKQTNKKKDILQKQTHQPNQQPLQDERAVCEFHFP